MEKSSRLLMTKVESPGAAVRCLLWCNWIQASEAELGSSHGPSDLGIWSPLSILGVFTQVGYHDDRLASHLKECPFIISSLQATGHREGASNLLLQRSCDLPCLFPWFKRKKHQGSIAKTYTEPTFSTFRSNPLRVEWEHT